MIDSPPSPSCGVAAGQILGLGFRILSHSEASIG